MEIPIKILSGFKGDRRGVTALEYGLIAAVIAVVIIAGASQLGNQINATFGSVATTSEAAVTQAEQ